MACKIKHCQRHNGPEGWVLLTKVTSLGHITSSCTNFDQTSSEFWPSTNFKVSTKYQQNVNLQPRLNFITTTNTFLIINMSNSNNLNKFELASSHARVTSSLPFVWETPVRVDRSVALWRGGTTCLPARQASQVFSTKKINCNCLGDGLEFPLPSVPCVTRTTPLWEEPLVASLHCAKTSLLYLEDHL